MSFTLNSRDLSFVAATACASSCPVATASASAAANLAAACPPRPPASRSRASKCCRADLSLPPQGPCHAAIPSFPRSAPRLGGRLAANALAPHADCLRAGRHHLPARRHPRAQRHQAEHRRRQGPARQGRLVPPMGRAHGANVSTATLTPHSCPSPARPRARPCWRRAAASAGCPSTTRAGRWPRPG